MRPLAFALYLGAFCAVAAPSMAAPELPGDVQQAASTLDRSAAPERGESAAVAALLDSVDQALAAERPEQALNLLERALRIEPRNPALWHYLGLAHLALGNNAQAEAMAAKSRSLDAGNRTLRTRNDRLMSAALRAQGKPEPPPRREARGLVSRLYSSLEPAATYADAREVYERQNPVQRRRDSISAARASQSGFVARSVTPVRDDRRTERARRERADAFAPRAAPRAERRSYRRYGSNGYAP